MELLSRAIAKEYQRAASALADEGLQDIGERRTLRIELQKRCGLSELEAVNVINGHHVQDYIAKYERRREEDERKQRDQDDGRMDKGSRRKREPHEF